MRPFRCDLPRKLLSVNMSVESRSGKPRLRGGLCHPRSSSFADVACIQSHGFITFSYPTASPSPLSKQLSTSSSSSGGAHVRWNTVDANGGRSELSSAASDVGLDGTQMHYVTSYSAAGLQTFHCEHERKLLLLGIDPNMPIGFLSKTKADWIDLRRGWQRYAALLLRHEKTYTNFGT